MAVGGREGVGMQRDEVIAGRIRAQQLDRPPAERAITDATVFDLGVQDTGRDGASWALANRGVPVASPAVLESSPDVALVWTLRSAPHFYRRRDLADVLVATSPFSDRDAAKRAVGADAALKAAGITSRAGLAEVATRMRELVTKPMVKGEVSGRLSTVLAEPYLRDCVSCAALHPWEVPFRIGAFYGGLELTPGTSPPVLRPIAGWSRPESGPAEEPLAAPAELQVIRAYLRQLGPCTPKDVAGFLEAPVADVKARWPTEAEPVTVEGRTAWVLPDEQGRHRDGPAQGGGPASAYGPVVRLLGPFDLLLQGRDRDLLVPDTGRHKSLWPTLGRPGAVLVGTEIVGTWRPRATAQRLELALDLWSPVRPAVRTQLEEQAERLADHRGVRLTALRW